MSKLTILYLDHAPIWGGAEAVLINLLGQLDREQVFAHCGYADGITARRPLPAYRRADRRCRFWST